MVPPLMSPANSVPIQPSGHIGWKKNQMNKLTEEKTRLKLEVKRRS